MLFTDNLYTIINKSETIINILLADENHPVFVAHFPAFPILPGFLQIDLINELFDIKISKIKKAKFIEIVKPKSELIFKKAKNKIIIESKDMKKISEIIYE